MKQLGWNAYAYDLKTDDGEASYGLDAPAISIRFDKSKMSAVGLLATTNRDEEGDICEVSGIDMRRHMRNPVVLLDHGKAYPLPIGKTKTPDGEYRVWIDGPDCYQETFFSQSLKMAEQVFHLICEDIMCANSIQYKVLEYTLLPADRENRLPVGKHVTRCQLVEATWCALPMNPDAVMATYYKDKVNGFVLCPELKEMLKPYITDKKSWRIPPMKKALEVRQVPDNEEHKDMSSVDETSGGALRDEQHKEMIPRWRGPCMEILSASGRPTGAMCRAATLPATGRVWMRTATSG